MVRGRDHVETDNFAHVDYVTAALAGRFTMVETMKVSQQDYQTRVLATARMYRLIGDLVGLGSTLSSVYRAFRMLSFRQGVDRRIGSVPIGVVIHRSCCIAEGQRGAPNNSTRPPDPARVRVREQSARRDDLPSGGRPAHSLPRPPERRALVARRARAAGNGARELGQGGRVPLRPRVPAREWAGRGTSEPHFVIRFRGADADDHNLDMRRLGQALIGVDRLVTHGLVALETGKFLRGRQPRPLAMRASGPTHGSLEVAAWLVEEVIGGMTPNGEWQNPLQADYPFASGESFRFDSNGGVGWGNPFDRDVETVCQDVLDEYISIDAARNEYGVVIDPETVTVDLGAKTLLR